MGGTHRARGAARAARRDGGPDARARAAAAARPRRAPPRPRRPRAILGAAHRESLGAARRRPAGRSPSTRTRWSRRCGACARASCCCSTGSSATPTTPRPAASSTTPASSPACATTAPTSARRSGPRKLVYAVTMTEANDIRPSFVVDVTPVWETKLRAIAAFASQFTPGPRRDGRPAARPLPGSRRARRPPPRPAHRRALRRGLRHARAAGGRRRRWLWRARRSRHGAGVRGASSGTEPSCDSQGESACGDGPRETLERTRSSAPVSIAGFGCAWCLRSLIREGPRPPSPPGGLSACHPACSASCPLGLLEDDAGGHVLLEAQRRLADLDHEGGQALEDVDGDARGEALGGEAGEQVRSRPRGARRCRTSPRAGRRGCRPRARRPAPAEEPPDQARRAAPRLVGHGVAAARAVLRGAAADRDRAAVLAAGVAAGLRSRGRRAGTSSWERPERRPAGSVVTAHPDAGRAHEHAHQAAHREPRAGR